MMGWAFTARGISTAAGQPPSGSASPHESAWATSATAQAAMTALSGLVRKREAKGAEPLWIRPPGAGSCVHRFGAGSPIWAWSSWSESAAQAVCAASELWSASTRQFVSVAG